MNIEPESADAHRLWAAKQVKKAITIARSEFVEPLANPYQFEHVTFTSVPEATERLLHAAIRGDRARSDQNEKRRHAPEEHAMSMTREELDARLQLVEAKADARLGRFEERMDQAIGEMRRDRADLKGEIKSSKWTVVGALVASVIAIVGGVAAFNATVLSNMVASFESGKNTMQSINDTTKRLEALQTRIEAAAQQEQRDRAPPSTPK